MIEIILLLTAFIGSTIAAVWDLKTTEIPDNIPYVMIVVALVLWGIQSYLSGDYLPILNSLAVGLSLLGFGFLMYFLGQWGGGDAKILSAIGFLLPTLPEGFLQQTFFPFSLSYFFDVFFVGAIYMIIYAIVISIMNRKIWSTFFNDLRANSKMIMLFNISMLVFLSILTLVANRYYIFVPLESMIRFEIVLFLTVIGFFLLWKFVKTVEEVGFKKKIPVSRLREGDVLLDSKIWEGVTKENLMKIKKSGKKYVWIKEGVRFAPAFPLALAFTVFFGGGISLLIGLI